MSISQTQSHNSVSFFEATVPIRLLGSQGESLDIILDNTENNQSFVHPVDFTVTNVQFDPNYDVICRNNHVILGTEQLPLDSQLTLFPNPTSEIVHIQKPQSLEINQIRVYNSLGQLLHEDKYSETIDLSSFAKEILFIQLETSEGIINKIIVKE